MVKGEQAREMTNSPIRRRRRRCHHIFDWGASVRTLYRLSGKGRKRRHVAEVVLDLRYHNVSSAFGTKRTYRDDLLIVRLRGGADMSLRLG